MAGPQTDPRVDAYIEQAPPFAQPVLRHLRALVHEAWPEIVEAIKWSMPHFVLRGRNLAGMAAFKAHCGFVIHGEGRQGNALGQFDRITSVEDVPPPEELIAKLREVGLRKSLEMKPRKVGRAPIPMPADFGAALAAVPAAEGHFEALAPSHRRDYLEWIIEAKTDATRGKRLAQAVEWLAEGKKRNWKYEQR